jgi:hypothetical protein
MNIIQQVKAFSLQASSRFYLDGANGIIMDESQQLSSHRMNIIQ